LHWGKSIKGNNDITLPLDYYLFQPWRIEPNEKESKKHHEMTLWFDSFLFLTTITLSLSLGLLVGMSTLAVDSTWFTVGEIAKYVGLSSAASFTGFVVGDMVNRSKEHKPESAFGYVNIDLSSPAPPIWAFRD
jgi:hypothetical protein